jgi:hypothetical protein
VLEGGGGVALGRLSVAMVEGGSAEADVASGDERTSSPHQDSRLLATGGPEPHDWERGHTTYLHAVHHAPIPCEGPDSAMADVSSFPLATSLGCREERDVPCFDLNVVIFQMR